MEVQEMADPPQSDGLECARAILRVLGLYAAVAMVVWACR